MPGNQNVMLYLKRAKLLLYKYIYIYIFSYLNYREKNVCNVCIRFFPCVLGKYVLKNTKKYKKILRKTMLCR